LEKKKFEGVTEDQGHAKLKQIFVLADRDGDMLLGLEELKDWIQTKILEYFKYSHDINSKKFKEMDINNDKKITWDEYIQRLHVPKGISQDAVRKFAEYHRPHSQGRDKVNDTTSHIMTPTEEMASRFLSKDQNNWEMADVNEDGELKEDEFLTFQHPEQNRRTVHNFYYILAK
jgi:Ca2+-binding EF-hand superfamily protein